MKKIAVWKKRILLALIAVTIFALLAVASSAMVGKDLMNYGDIAKVDREIISLDAKKDDAYNAATPITIGYQSYNSNGEGLNWYPRKNGEAPATGTAYILSDSEYLWVYVEVTDATLNTYAPSPIEAKYTQDSVELLIDWTNDGFNVAEETPYQMRVSHEGYISGRIGQKGYLLQGTEELGSKNPVRWFDGTAVHTENGYACEFKIDIPVYKYGDDINEYISIGININDYDSSGTSNSRIIVTSDSKNGSNQWIVNKLGYAGFSFDPYSGSCGDNLVWSFDPHAGVLDILGGGAMYDYEPNEAPWYAYRNDIISVNISDEVTYIGKTAFYNCYGITSVTIPESVTNIGDSAFWACYKLVEVINHSELALQKGDEENGAVAYYCIEVHDGESKIVSENDFKFYTAGGVNYLWDYVGNAAKLVLPENYNSENYIINDFAFYNYKFITDAVIPESVISIGEYAFFGCDRLTNIEIANGVAFIEREAFAHCNSITSIEIPESVKAIGKGAFAVCNELNSIIINSRDVELFDSEETITPKATIIGYGGSTAEAYAEKYKRDFVEIIPKITFESKKVVDEETFTVDVLFSDMPKVKSFIIKDFIYDSETVTLISGDINVKGAITHWDSEENIATVTFENATDCNGCVLTLTFEVKNEFKETVEISADTVVVKGYGSVSGETEVASEIVAGEIELLLYMIGDVNADRVLDTDDAIYLLRHTMLPNEYPINQSGDMNGDGVVNSNDAIYLLRHILMPQEHPIG